MLLLRCKICQNTEKGAAAGQDTTAINAAGGKIKNRGKAGCGVRAVAVAKTEEGIIFQLTSMQQANAFVNITPREDMPFLIERTLKGT